MTDEDARALREELSVIRADLASLTEIVTRLKAQIESRASAGGKARAVKLTPEERREIARKAAHARWAHPNEPPKRRR